MSRESPVSRAIAEAEALARETGDSRDIYALVGVRLEGADPKGAVVDARRLLERTDLPPESYLRLAHALQIEDRSAAGAHLDKALAASNDSPSFLAAALDLIFRLNREEKLPELHPALARASTPGGPIELSGPERLLEILGAQTGQRERAESLYKAGSIPLHLALEIMGSTLAEVYYNQFHPTDAHRWPFVPPLYFMHGGRAAASKSQPIKSLYFDLSSIILASELDILDAVERTFEHIGLPYSTIPTLYHYIEAAQFHQPTKLQEAQTIAGLLGSGKLNTGNPAPRRDATDAVDRPTVDWMARLTAARDADGFLVDYLPINVGFPPQPANISEEEAKFIVDVGSVLHTLERAGRLDEERTGFARQKLHTLVSGPPQEIHPGTSLYLHGNIAEVLASSGILEAATEFFKVFIEESERRRIEWLLDQEARRAQLRGTIRALIERIQHGLGKAWFLLPESREIDVAALHYESRCLAELMTAEPVSGGYVCIDDRTLNAFGTCGKMPVITILDLLRALRASDSIDGGRLSSRLHRIRAANLRFLPMAADDVVYQLSAAKIQDGELRESAELTVLRQYTAACLSERGQLQFPPMPEGSPNPTGELALLLNVLENTRLALVTLWAAVTPENVAEVETRADWLLQSLWCDAASLAWIAGRGGEVQKEFQAGGLMQMYVAGLGLKGTRRWKDPSRPSPRILYFKWLAKRFAHDEESVKATGRHLREIFINDKFAHLSDNPHLIDALLGEFATDLPRSLYAILDLPKGVLRRIGVAFHDAIVVGRYTFHGAKFWRAAEVAARGRPVQIATHDSASIFELKYLRQSTDHVICLLYTS